MIGLTENLLTLLPDFGTMTAIPPAKRLRTNRASSPEPSLNAGAGKISTACLLSLNSQCSAAYIKRRGYGLQR
jgi:hypothetical protein